MCSTRRNRLKPGKGTRQKQTPVKPGRSVRAASGTPAAPGKTFPKGLRAETRSLSRSLRCERNVSAEKHTHHRLCHVETGRVAPRHASGEIDTSILGDVVSFMQESLVLGHGPKRRRAVTIRGYFSGSARSLQTEIVLPSFRQVCPW